MGWWWGGGVDTDALPSSSPSLIWLSWGFGLTWAVTIGGYYRSTSIYKVLLVSNALCLHDPLCFYGSKCNLCKMFNLSKCYTKFVSTLISEEDEDPSDARDDETTTMVEDVPGQCAIDEATA